MEITDDKKATANRVRLPSTDLKAGRHVEAGRVLVVTNADSEGTTGDVAIPAKTTVLLVSDGARFVSVDALRAPMSDLEGVRSLRAAADLDIGNHTLTAAAFAFPPSSTSDKNTLLFAGPNGVIRAAAGLHYARGVLSVPSLAVDALTSDVDAQFHSLQ